MVAKQELMLHRGQTGMNRRAQEQELLSSMHKVCTGFEAVTERLMPSGPRITWTVLVTEWGRTGQLHVFYIDCKKFTYVNELNLLIHLLEKEEISGMRQMDLKILSTIISLFAIDVVTSLEVPYARGMLEGCKARFTLLVV